MSHFDEMACMLFLEGQLDESRASELMVHVGACTECAAMLHALQSESSLLGSALTDETDAIPARFLGSERWTVPAWGWTLAFGLFAAGAYWLWTDNISPWVEQISNAGFGGLDLAGTLLFTGAFWEGWGDMVNAMEIGALIIAVIGAAALLRRRLSGTAITIVMCALALAVALPQPAAAAEVRRGNSVVVASSETLHNDLVAAGQAIRIDGTVEGDVIAFTRDLTVTGHVTGDVIAFAAQVRMDGTVDGNVRIVSNTVNIGGSVGKNLTSIANTLDLTSSARVGGGLISIGAEVNLDGKIQRDLLGLIARTYLGGSIGGQMWVRGATLAFASTAAVAGQTTFHGREQPAIAPGATLASPMNFEMTQERGRSRLSHVRSTMHAIFSYGTALLVAILLITVLPGFFRSALRAAGAVGFPIGVGALALLAGGFVSILGVLLLLVGVGAGIAAAALYAPVLYVAQVIVSAWLGNRLLGEKSETTTAVMGRIALGLLIIHVAGRIPFLGNILWLVVLLWGAGAVLIGFYRICRMDQPAVAIAAD